MPEKIKVLKIICVLLLLPLLYVNVRDSHDWGDDFAQYILQARNIIENRAQTENGLIFDSVDGDFALRAYPAGFPLLISPIYYFFCLSVKPYLLLISLFMIGFGLLLFNFFSRFFSPMISLFAVILILYNHYLLQLKDSILSDIPFSFFLFLLINYTLKKKTSYLYFILCGLLSAWLTSIRFIGIASVAALIMDIFYRNFSKPNKFLLKENVRESIRPVLLVLLFSTGFFFLFNSLIFHVDIKYFFGFYSNSFGKESSPVLTNAGYYLDVLGTIFRYPGNMESLTGWWVILAIAGWILNLKRKAGFPEWFFLFYLIVILFFNRHTSGFRFLLPIFPLLIKYSLDTLLNIYNLLSTKHSEKFLIISLMILFTGYIDPLKITVRKQNTVFYDGPYTKTSQEMLSTVRDQIPRSEVIGFIKALVISLYTDHRATYLMTGQTPQLVEAMFARQNVNFLIVSKNKSFDTDIYDPRIDAYLELFRSRYEIFWENSEFIILKRIHPEK